MRAPPPSMPTIAALAITTVLATSACGNGDDVCTTASALSSDAGADGGPDATSGRQSADGSADGGGEGTSPQADTALIRFANWSSDSPAVDFCLAPHGTTAFQGPMLASLAARIDGAGLVDAGAPVLQFPDVSTYETVEPQTYDARVVAAGSANCSVAVAPDTTNLAPLAAGSFSTIALIGALNPTAGAPGVQLVAFLDSPAASLVDARFINAAYNAGSVSIGVGTILTGFASLFSDVPFPQAGTITGQIPDAELPTSVSYVETNPLTNATVSVVNPAWTETLLAAPGVYLADGAVVTFALVGPVDDLGADGGLSDQLLMCVDNAGTVGLLSNCQVIGP
jgi:hypothetical protein